MVIHTVPWGQCPGCSCGGLDHQHTDIFAGYAREKPSLLSVSMLCLSSPALCNNCGGWARRLCEDREQVDGGMLEQEGKSRAWQPWTSMEWRLLEKHVTVSPAELTDGDLGSGKL